MSVLMPSFVTKHVPTVSVLTTGGTIAGTAQSATSASYQSGAQRGAELLSAVPGLASLAELRVLDVVAKDSADLLFEDWVKLYQAVSQALADVAVDAVVITHGTDTLEETAFFLDTLLRSNKPVILVGAMRPATALSADGPLNLFNAVAVAVSPLSFGRGVLVVMNDRIMTARAVSKSHTSAVQAFASPNDGGFGAGIGHVFLGSVRYDSDIREMNDVRPIPFSDWSQLDRLNLNPPHVEILYVHAAMSLPVVCNADSAHKKTALKGLVLAGLGAGNVPACLKTYIRDLQQQGVVVVRSTRVWAGGVIPDYQGLDTDLNVICANDLSPHKARILLMLALRFSCEVQQIRHCFAALP